MDLYTRSSYAMSKSLTLAYSTSFGTSSRLFSSAIRPHIFAIYGLVRIADEIVDGAAPNDQRTLLDQLEVETYQAIQRGFSANLIVHSFAVTARRFGIDESLIAPFFDSMRMDLALQKYTQKLYDRYIYGSAEVIGLMCLKVFCSGSSTQYKELQSGAAKLGSAYQKVNFLRDLKSDYETLGRLYFPGLSYSTLSNQQKDSIVANIRDDMDEAVKALRKLPRSSRVAVMTSYSYYNALLQKLANTPIATIKRSRVRISNTKKFWLLLVVILKEIWRP